MPPLPSPLSPGPKWQLDDLTLQRLAQELARDVYSPRDVLARFGIEPEVFQKFIRTTPTFVRHFTEAHTMWHSAGNTSERVQLKAQAMFEEWLGEADRLFHDQNQPMSAKMELLKTVGRVGGLDRDKEKGHVAPGERVLVQINLQAAGQVSPVLIDKVASAVPVRVTDV